jgi:hypothetical protein
MRAGSGASVRRRTAQWPECRPVVAVSPVRSSQGSPYRNYYINNGPWQVTAVLRVRPRIGRTAALARATGVAVFPHDIALPVRALAEQTDTITHWTEFEAAATSPHSNNPSSS